MLISLNCHGNNEWIYNYGLLKWHHENYYGTNKVYAGEWTIKHMYTYINTTYVFNQTHEFVSKREHEATQC